MKTISKTSTMNHDGNSAANANAFLTGIIQGEIIPLLEECSNVELLDTYTGLNTSGYPINKWVLDVGYENLYLAITLEITSQGTNHKADIGICKTPDAEAAFLLQQGNNINFTIENKYETIDGVRQYYYQSEWGFSIIQNKNALKAIYKSFKMNGYTSAQFLVFDKDVFGKKIICDTLSAYKVYFEDNSDEPFTMNATTTNTAIDGYVFIKCVQIMSGSYLTSFTKDLKTIENAALGTDGGTLIDVEGTHYRRLNSIFWIEDED